MNNKQKTGIAVGAAVATFGAGIAGGAMMNGGEQAPKSETSVSNNVGNKINESKSGMPIVTKSEAPKPTDIPKSVYEAPAATPEATPEATPKPEVVKGLGDAACAEAVEVQDAMGEIGEPIGLDQAVEIREEASEYKAAINEEAQGNHDEEAVAEAREAADAAYVAGQTGGDDEKTLAAQKNAEVMNEHCEDKVEYLSMPAGHDTTPTPPTA